MMTDAEDITDDPEFADLALPVGTSLSGGQFTITGLLGAGGFGITYVAEDRTLQRDVVIKECFPGDVCLRRSNNVIARSKSLSKPFEAIVQMFMREARSLARLRHPNIVGVHGAFEEFGTAYMVLDRIDGPDLLDVLEKNETALTPRRITDILLTLLDAVEAVHEGGLLHRDISPDNIIIEKSGNPVLIDFGAARADVGNRTRAASSMLVVKDGYSPQEFYIAGAEQTPSSDLYALGATFYHVLTGHPPPDSQSRLLELAGRRDDPCKPLLGQVEGFDDDFLRAIDHAMCIHPVDRLQSAAQWKSMLNELALAGMDVTRLRPSQLNVSLELERTLSDLVRKTNSEVQGEPAEPKPKAKTPPAPVEEKRAAPDWLEEFNRQSLTRLEPATEPAPSPPAENTDAPDAVAALPADEPGDVQTIPRPRVPPVQSGTNWVGRAIEKQEEQLALAREALERELEEASRGRWRSRPDPMPEPVCEDEAEPDDAPPKRSLARIFAGFVVYASVGYFLLGFA